MSVVAGAVRPVQALLDRFIPGGALLLATLTFATYGVGLLRDRLFARTFGLSAELDAYNAAFVLPELVLDVLIASGLTAPFVPIFLGLKEGSLREAQRFGQTVLTLAVVVMAGVAAVLFVFAPQTAAIIAPGFGPEQQALYTDLFRIMLLTPVLFAASIALGEVLVAERRFFFYGLAPLLYNLGIVVGTVTLSGRIGIYAPAVGAVLGAVAHLGIRVAGAIVDGFPIRTRLDWRMPAVGEFVKLMLPKMISQPIEPVTFLIFTSVASTIATGAVTAVSFARNFQSLPVSLIGISFSVAAFPALSAAWAEADRPRFVRLVGTNALTIGSLSAAATIALLLLGGIGIRVFLGGENFGESDIATTTLALSFFALSIPFESLFYLFSRAIYATHNTLLAVLANLGGFLVTLVLAPALAPSLGIAAIPLAFTIGTAVKVVLLLMALGARLRTPADVPATELPIATASAPPQ
jgi:putative peptidoglycan lipid II flippase